MLTTDDESILPLTAVELLHDILCKLSAEDVDQGVWHLIHEDWMDCLPDFEAHLHELLTELNSYDATWDAVHVFHHSSEKLQANSIVSGGRHGSQQLRHVKRPVQVYGAVGLLVHGTHGAQRLLRVLIDETSNDLGLLFEAMGFRTRTYVSCTPLLLGESLEPSPLTLRTQSGRWHHPVIGGLGSRRPIHMDTTVSEVPAVVRQSPERHESEQPVAIDMQMRRPGAQEVIDLQYAWQDASKNDLTTRTSQRPNTVDALGLRRPLAANLDLDDGYPHIEIERPRLDPRLATASLASRRPGACDAVGASASLEEINPVGLRHQKSAISSSPRETKKMQPISPSLDKALDDVYHTVLWQSLQMERAQVVAGLVATTTSRDDRVQNGQGDCSSSSPLAQRENKSDETRCRNEDRTHGPGQERSIAVRARAIAEQLRANSATERAMDVLTGSRGEVDPEWRGEFNLTEQGRVRPNVVRL